MTFRTLASRCLSEAQPQVLDLAAYRTALRCALQPALRCAWADAPAAEITRGHIEALRTQRLAEGVKVVTAGRSVLAVQIVWKWAQAQGLLPEGLKCPCKGVPIGKSAVLIETYPDDQRAWIFAAAKAARNPMLYPFLVCAMNSAMRKGELFGLCWPRVVLRGGSPRFLVEASYAHAPKSGKPRTVPIVSPLVIEVLTAWRALCPPTEAGLVFPVQGRHGWRMGRPKDLVREVRDILREGGIPQLVHPIHAARHTFATEWCLGERDIVALKELLGHKSLDTTMIYVNYVASHLRRKMQGFELGQGSALALVRPGEVPPAPSPAPLQPIDPRSLPDLADLGDRRAWLQQLGRAIPAMKKLTTVRARARAAGVPPRWLGFNERAPGTDAEGFGVRLRLQRGACGLTQRQLVAASGVSAGMISMLEAEKQMRTRPLTTTLSTVVRLAGAIGVSPGWLAFGGPEKG